MEGANGAPVVCFIIPQDHHSMALLVFSDRSVFENSGRDRYNVDPWVLRAIRLALPNHLNSVSDHRHQVDPDHKFCLVWAFYALCTVDGQNGPLNLITHSPLSFAL